MAINFDDHEIEIPCGKCGKQIKTKLGKAKRDPSIECPACCAVTTIDASSYRDQEKKINAEIENLLKNFGKR